MFGEPQTNGATTPPPRPQETNSTKTVGAGRREAPPTLSARTVTRKPVDTAVFEQDGSAISPEKTASLRRALEEYREILIFLVKESASTPKDIFRGSILAFLHSMKSRSIFGRQLSHEELVGQYASLYPILGRPANLAYAETALFGILALKSERSAIAQTVLEEVRFGTTSVALVYVMRGVMRFAYAAILIGVFLAYLIVAGYSFEGELPWLIRFDSETTRVGVAALFGCLGAVVSLLMRLAEFERMRGKSKEFLFLSGGTQPLVGGIVAAVIAAIIFSEVVTVTGINGTSKLWLFVVVGFISGFSERFTRSMLGIAENRFSVDASKPDRIKARPESVVQ
jgi:hypothetical protein